MASSSEKKNIGSKAGSHTSHKAGTQAEKTLSSDSEQENIKDVERLIQKNFEKVFIAAKVLFGKVYPDKSKSKRFKWDDATVEVILDWSDSCNSEGEEGIRCDNGMGFGGWDEKRGFYVSHKNGYKESEHCMRVVEIVDTKNKDEDSESEQEQSKDLKTHSGKQSLAKDDPEPPISSKKLVTDSKISSLVESITIAIRKVFSVSDLGDTTLVEKVISSVEMSKALETAIAQSFSKSKNPKTKKTKDPNAPKKPKSSYLFYCIEQRSIVQRKNPELSSTNVTTKMAEEWNKLSDKKKAPYIEKAEEDKERYKSEMSSYTPPEKDAEEPLKEKKPRKVAEKKKREGPKKPLSSYMFYCIDQRSKVKEDSPDLDSKEITRELGRLWNEMSEKEKSFYVEKADADKKRYENEKNISAPDSKESEPFFSSSKEKKKKESSDEDKTPISSKKTKQESKSDSEKESLSAKKKKKSSNSKSDKDIQIPEEKPENEVEENDEENSESDSEEQDSGFTNFCIKMRKKVREKHPDIPIEEVTKRLKAKWRELSPSGKAKFKTD